MSCRQRFVFFPKVEVDFDQNKYYGSAMDGITQMICLTIGSKQTELVEMSGGSNFNSFSASIRTSGRNVEAQG